MWRRAVDVRPPAGQLSAEAEGMNTKPGLAAAYLELPQPADPRLLFRTAVALLDFVDACTRDHRILTCLWLGAHAWTSEHLRELSRGAQAWLDRL
jgi:hypothetical protein